MKLLPQDTKKRGDCPLLAPRFEAVGLPITVRTSNYNPTPICKRHIQLINRMSRMVGFYIPYGHLSLPNSLTVI